MRPTAIAQGPRPPSYSIAIATTLYPTRMPWFASSTAVTRYDTTAHDRKEGDACALMRRGRYRSVVFNFFGGAPPTLASSASRVAPMRRAVAEEVMLSAVFFVFERGFRVFREAYSL